MNRISMVERFDRRYVATRSLAMFVKAMREAHEYLANARAFAAVARNVGTDPTLHCLNLVALANNRTVLAWAWWYQREDILSGAIPDWPSTESA